MTAGYALLGLLSLVLGLVAIGQWRTRIDAERAAEQRVQDIESWAESLSKELREELDAKLDGLYKAGREYQFGLDRDEIDRYRLLFSRQRSINNSLHAELRHYLAPSVLDQLRERVLSRLDEPPAERLQ